MISFVLDASTAVSWCFEEVQTPYAIGVLGMVSEGAALKLRLTTYDAAYLELAQRRGLPIASVDGNLVQAAAAARVPVLKP